MSRSNFTTTGASRLGPQPTQDDMRRIYRAFDPGALITICTTSDFSLYANKTTLQPATHHFDERFYWYQDNGADILAVAHLDSVQDDTTCHVVDAAAGPLVVCPTLDDRLGAYVILELLPALGVRCDILLTTDEEMGRSTATEFAQDHLGNDGKRYNWIIEFDRGGTDVVMYDYETPEYVGLVEAAGARVGRGSYSDIADLESLGCAAFNWGVGYEDYHSERAHAWLADTFRMVGRFLNFHAANFEQHLPHEARGWRAFTSTTSSALTWEDDDDILPFGALPDLMEADCGHLIDIDDEDTYHEFQHGKDTFFLACTECAGL